MYFVSLALASLIQQRGIAVPPPAKLVIGHSTERSGTITAQPCDSPEKMTKAFVLTSALRSVGKDGVNVMLVKMAPEGEPGALFTLKTNSRGIPVSCTAVGQGDDGQGITFLLLYMRQPLWPLAKKASSWNVSLPNPISEKAKAMKVACHVRAVPGKPSVLLLEEKSDLMELAIGGSSMQAVSQIQVDKRTGAVLSVHESLDIYFGGKKAQMMTYEERPK